MTDAALPVSPSGARTRVLSVLGDDRLASLAARGDSAAFAAIYERYLQRLHRYCQAIVGNPEDASDCLQSAMLKAFAALRASNRNIALKPWLYRIAHNESISLLRRRRPEVEGDEENLGWAPPAEADAATREHLKQLMADLRELPERQRGAIVLRELGGFEVSELAAWLGTSEGAARQTLFQGRRSLQDYAEGRDMDCEDVRKAISDGDGRSFGNRKLRAHLRECEGCREFRVAIAARESDLKAIAPPVPAALALGLVKSFFGGGGAGGAGVTGALGGAAVGAKVAAAAAAAAVVVAGTAAGIGIVIDLSGEERPSGRQESQPQAPTTDNPSPGSSGGLSGGASSTGDRAERRSGDRAAPSNSEPAVDSSRELPETATAVVPTTEGEANVDAEAPVSTAFTAPTPDLGLVAPSPVSTEPVADRRAPRGNGRACEDGGDIQAAQTGRGCRIDCRTDSEQKDRGREGRGSRGRERCRADELDGNRRRNGDEDNRDGRRGRGDERGRDGDGRNSEKDERGRDRREKEERERAEKDQRDREDKDARERESGGESNGRASASPFARSRSPSAMSSESWAEGGAAPPPPPSVSTTAFAAPAPAPAPASAPTPVVAPAPAPAPPPPPQATPTP